MSCAQLAVSFALLATICIPPTNAVEKLRNKRNIVIANGARSANLNLRVCNAFTDKTPVAIHMKPEDTKDTDLTGKELLHYKSCRDWPVHLMRGTSLEFLQGGAQLGAFEVTSVPQWNAVLLLVIHRKGSSNQLGFASNVFSKSKNAQMAVLDTYTGASKDSIVISEKKESIVAEKGHKLSVLAENLAYNTVVAMNHGNYFCTLSEHVHGTNMHARRVAFSVNDGESYVAMRVGMQGKDGFPEELVVFPESGSYRVCVLSFIMPTILLLLLG